MRQSISSGHFSHDQQVKDAVDHLTSDERALFDEAFPEWDTLTWSDDSSWLDCDENGVDPEYTSWVCDWIENNTAVYWEDGEPWLSDGHDDEEE